jgi:chromosome segregation ATPase
MAVVVAEVRYVHLEDYQREVDRVTKLQDMVVGLQEQLAKSSGAAEGKIGVLREKLAASLSVNVELRTRIKSLEDSVERRDQVVKDWTKNIVKLETELHKLTDENQQYAQERELVRSALTELLPSEAFNKNDSIESLLSNISKLMNSMFNNIEQRDEDRLRDDIASCEDRDRYKSEIDHLCHSMDKLTAENSNLRNMLEDEQEHSHQLEVALQEVNQAYEESQIATTEIMNKNKTLTSQLSKMSKELDALKINNSDINDHSGSCRGQKKLKDVYERKIDQKNREFDELRQHIEDMEQFFRKEILTFKHKDLPQKDEKRRTPLFDTTSESNRQVDDNLGAIHRFRKVNNK